MFEAKQRLVDTDQTGAKVNAELRGVSCDGVLRRIQGGRVARCKDAKFGEHCWCVLREVNR